MLSVVELEVNGQPVKIDGFRLKEPSHWLVNSSGDPAEIADEHTLIRIAEEAAAPSLSDRRLFGGG